MRLFSFLPRPPALVVAVAGLLASAGSASAGWNNVFQLTCNDCNRQPRVSYFAEPACPQKPQQRVEYQQRSYYEPVTVMKPEKYLEPVEVRSKSFYWEPVTSYSYSCYVDPCTGCKQQIATPRTSYRLQESCNTSMRYVERTRMVPVQSQRLVTETVPVVTYYLPPTRSYSSPVEACPPGAPAPAPSGGPRVDELRSPPSIAPEGGATIPPQQLPTNSGGTALPRSAPPQARPLGKVNAHTTSRPIMAGVRGEVVQNDQSTPRPAAKVVFVSAANTEIREYVTADAFGNFDTRLLAGDWYIYLGDGNGKATFHKKITVGEDARDFKLVSR